MKTDCPSCGAPVVIAPLAPVPDATESPGRVVLDRHESASGAGRYAIWDDGKARAVAAGVQILAYPLHQCRPPLPR